MSGPSRLSPSTIGAGLIAAGVVLVLVAILADVIGLGRTRTYYGHYQFIATVVGLSLIVLGVTVLLSTIHDEHGE